MNKTMIGNLFNKIGLTSIFLSAVLILPLTLGMDISGAGAQEEDLKTAIDSSITTTVGGAGLSTAETSLSAVVGGIIRQVLGLIGIVLVVIVIYAGFLWLTAGGNAEQVKKAKQWLINAIIGIIIVFSAYAITNFVVDAVL